VPDELDTIEFVFTHPTNFRLITGNVEDLSSMGLSFTPDDAQYVEDLGHDVVIPSCSLRVGDDILSFSTRIVRNERRISFSYLSISESERATINSYIESREERESTAEKPQG
jgi:hypothetical protein